MSNTVKSYIEVNRAVYGGDVKPDGFYAAFLEKSGRISIRTKWAPTVGAIANLAYSKKLNLTLEFESFDNSEIGSLKFFRKPFWWEIDTARDEDYYPSEVDRAIDAISETKSEY